MQCNYYSERLDSTQLFLNAMNNTVSINACIPVYIYMLTHEYLLSLESARLVPATDGSCGPSQTLRCCSTAATIHALTRHRHW